MATRQLDSLAANIDVTDLARRLLTFQQQHAGRWRVLAALLQVSPTSKILRVSATTELRVALLKHTLSHQSQCCISKTLFVRSPQNALSKTYLVYTWKQPTLHTHEELRLCQKQAFAMAIFLSKC